MNDASTRRSRADLPLGTIRYTASQLGLDVRCEVVVNGEPVCNLPCSGLEFVHDWGSRPVIKLRLPADKVDIGSHKPEPPTATPEERERYQAAVRSVGELIATDELRRPEAPVSAEHPLGGQPPIAGERTT